MAASNKVPEVPQVPDARDTTSAYDAWTALHYNGIHLDVTGQSLVASPADRLNDQMRELIRLNKPALMELLKAGIGLDMRREFAAALQTGRLVVCATCAHYAARPTRQPDGWCALHGEIWSLVPFDCRDYRETEDQ